MRIFREFLGVKREFLGTNPDKKGEKMEVFREWFEGKVDFGTEII